MRKIYTLITVAVFCCQVTIAETVTATFEDIALTASYDMGKNANGKFTSNGFDFSNSYSVSQYGEYYSGFAISTSQSTAYSEATYIVDQFNSCAGCGADSSKTYAVFYYYGNASIKNSDGKLFTPQSVKITNNSYAFDVMRFGNTYARRFFEDDKLSITFIGYKNGEPTGAETTVNLAEEGLIVFNWKTIDLTPLGEVDEIRFNMISTDADPIWGNNTPVYCCMDDFKADVSTATAAKAATALLDDAKELALYSADGKQLSRFQKGLNIIKMSDGSIRKVYK